jgi:Flp pilus assembly protein TadG
MKSGRRFSRLFFDEEGTAAIEFGVIGTFLGLLLLGLVDFGMGYWRQMQVGNAARAGVEYAITNGWDQAKITTVVGGATGWGSITATPAPTKTCGCPDVTAGIAAATCGASCTGGGTAGTYVNVNARASYSTVFTYPGIANPLTLNASTSVRIQ